MWLLLRPLPLLALLLSASGAPVPGDESSSENSGPSERDETALPFVRLMERLPALDGPKPLPQSAERFDPADALALDRWASRMAYFRRNHGALSRAVAHLEEPSVGDVGFETYLRFGRTCAALFLSESHQEARGDKWRWFVLVDMIANRLRAQRDILLQSALLEIEYTLVELFSGQDAVPQEYRERVAAWGSKDRMRIARFTAITELHSLGEACRRSSKYSEFDRTQRVVLRSLANELDRAGKALGSAPVRSERLRSEAEIFRKFGPNYPQAIDAWQWMEILESQLEFEAKGMALARALLHGRARQGRSEKMENSPDATD